MSADLAQQRRESIEQAKQVDDLKGEDPAGYGTGYTQQQDQATAEGHPSEDEENQMNYKFGASRGTLMKSGGIAGRAEDGRQSKGKSGLAGSFLQSKQMVFGADAKLMPAAENAMSDSAFQGVQGKNRQANNSYGAMVNQGVAASAVPQGQSENVLEAAHQISEGKTQLKQIINILEEDKIRMAADEAKGQQVHIPETEEEIMAFLEQAQLENQPTEVLYQLADKLKERRTKLYPEEKMLDGGSDNMELEDEDVGLETDRKAGKSEDINFELGSDQQLKKMGSS